MIMMGKHRNAEGTEEKCLIGGGESDGLLTVAKHSFVSLFFMGSSLHVKTKPE